MVVEFLPFIVQLVFGALSIYLINSDIEEKGIDRKFYWIWSIGIVVGLLILGLIGILVVLASYFVWSRYIQE